MSHFNRHATINTAELSVTFDGELAELDAERFARQLVERDAIGVSIVRNRNRVDVIPGSGDIDLDVAIEVFADHCTGWFGADAVTRALDGDNMTARVRY